LLFQVKNNAVINLGLVVLSALLFILSWQPFGLFPLIFFVFVPLFFLEERIRIQNPDSSRLMIFLFGFLTFILWNTGTIYWIWNASEGGAILAILINSLLMISPFLLYHIFQKRSFSKKEFWPFIFMWLAIEYLHSRWDLAFPWLSLGNVFSTMPQTVQWYEYTGVFGGSLWVLYANQKIFNLLKIRKTISASSFNGKAFNLIFFVLFTPIFLSWYILDNRERTQAGIRKNKASIVIVQPNIDPYSEKFSGLTPKEQLSKMLRLASSKVDSLTQFVILPETALQGPNDESLLDANERIQEIREFIMKYPGLCFLTGADSYKFFISSIAPTTTARKYSEGNYYDVYNSAFFISNIDSFQIYHKAKLVPGVEKMPYPFLFSFLEPLAIKLGGSSGSLASDAHSKNFYSQHKIPLAPIICYESVFGEYVATYVKNGAGILCIITNDGWWGNTPGYQQHLDFGRLRAIETRRYIARAANTGISAFIDDRGNILQKTDWWVEDALSMSIPVNTEETFYVKNGDIIAFAAVILALMEVFRLFFRIKRRL